MDLLILSVFLGLVAIVSILLDRWWQRRTLPYHAEQPVGQSSPLAANGHDNTLLEQIKTGWHKRMGWRTQPAAEQPKLRAWLIANLADHPPVQQWLAGLSDSEFTALHQQLHAFCLSMKIDLAWLGEQALAQDPALQATVQTIVLHYVQAQHQAVAVQADLQAFKTYLALEQRPYSYEYQPLIQQLYTQLVKAGLTAPARPEALLATEKIRIDHMLRAIQSAADANRPAFYQVLNAVSNLSQPDGAAPPLSSGTPSSQPATVTTS